MLRSSNIQNSQLDFNDNVYVDSSIVPDRIRTRSNDVLMCVRNGSKSLVGKTALISDEHSDLAWGAFMTVLRPNTNNTLLYHYLNSPSFRKQVFPDLETATVKQITMSTLNRIKLLVPNTDEQDKISDFLSALDKRIEKQRQLVEALKSYKRGVSNRIFRDMYDSSWRTICLGDICSITMGQSPDSSSYNTDGIGVPLVQGNADITNGITTPLRYTSNPTKVCESGSIILSVRAPVGTVSRANQRVCLGRGVCAITSSNTDFIYQLLLCYQDSWKRIEQGGTFTAISGDDIGSFSVSVPDCELQNRIAVFLSQFDTKIRNEDIILQSLQKQKSALLQQLFI